MGVVSLLFKLYACELAQFTFLYLAHTWSLCICEERVGLLNIVKNKEL